jgi:hypothetical protein
MNKFAIAFGGAIVIISWQDIKQCHELPWPPRFIYAGLTFGIIDLISLWNDQLAGLVAIGFLLALLTQSLVKPQCTRPQGTPQPSTMAEISGGPIEGNPNMGTSVV